MPDPLSPPSISTLPLGLLRYLGIQSGGRFPQTLGEVVSPSFDLMGLTTASTDTDFAETVASTGTGFFDSTTIIVSQRKVVRCTMLSARVVTAAGEAINFCLINHTASNQRIALTPATGAIGASSGGALALIEEFWLGPGDIIGIQTFSQTGASINVSIALRKSDFFF